MTHAFTDRPWHIDKRWTKSLNGAQIVNHRGVLICSIPQETTKPYQQLAADARLIALAPMTFEILIETRQFLSAVKWTPARQYPTALMTSLYLIENAVEIDMPPQCETFFYG